MPVLVGTGAVMGRAKMSTIGSNGVSRCTVILPVELSVVTPEIVLALPLA